MVEGVLLSLRRWRGGAKKRMDGTGVVKGESWGRAKQIGRQGGGGDEEDE